MPRRVIPFPQAFSLGEIFIADLPTQDQDKMLRGAARGNIVVPAGKFVMFSPGRRFFEDPKRINNLPANAVDCLEITASSMDDSEDGLCDRGLSYIGHFKTVRKLILDRSDATDKGASFASELPDLQVIHAFATMVEGKCMQKFAGLKKLRCLFFHSSPIKDEYLKYCGAIPNLQYLSISGSGISDAGIKNLSSCVQLADLDIGNNVKITDQSVAYLINMKHLRNLRLGNTSITISGILKLKGLPLTQLELPSANHTLDQLKAVKKTFPAAYLCFVGKRHADINSETKTIFAPLH